MDMVRRPVALVTGASRGIGRGIAEELASAGFSVAINYKGNREAALECSASCVGIALRNPSPEKGTARFEAFQADVGDRRDRTRLVSEVYESFGTIDALVNNAGMGPRQRADLLDATEESFEEIIRTNLQGPYFLTQDVTRRWVAETAGGAHGVISGGRKVIFISSISAETASINRGEYCVSKAGIAMAVKLFAARLADENIQVYEVRPGIVATDMTAGVKEKYDRLIGDGIVPQKRWGVPKDVGTAVASLLAGSFSYSTGAVIPVDGGFNISRL